MRTATRNYLVALLLITGLVSACDQGGQGVQQQESNLRQALAAAPTGYRMAFTDWTLLKKYMGMESITPIQSEDDLEKLMPKFESQLPAAFHGRDSLFSGDKPVASVWGWDFTDLLWEAELTIEGERSGSPVSILKLRDTFDLAPVVQHFKERDFRESDYQGAKMYSHAIDLTADWETQGFGLSVYNTAIIQDKKLLILSNGKESVEAVLDVMSKGKAGSLASDNAVMEMVGRMGELGSVVIRPGVLACKEMGGRAILIDELADPDARAEFEQLRATIDKLRPYEALAGGYSYSGEQSLAIVAMQYANADDAKADLEARRALLFEGKSTYLWERIPYNQIITERNGESAVEVEGNTLIVRVKGNGVKSEFDGLERDLIPRMPFDMMIARDMTFAACP